MACFVRAMTSLTGNPGSNVGERFCDFSQVCPTNELWAYVRERGCSAKRLLEEVEHGKLGLPTTHLAVLAIKII